MHMPASLGTVSVICYISKIAVTRRVENWLMQALNDVSSWPFSNRLLTESSHWITTPSVFRLHIAMPLVVKLAILQLSSTFIEKKLTEIEVEIIDKDRYYQQRSQPPHGCGIRKGPGRKKTDFSF